MSSNNNIQISDIKSDISLNTETYTLQVKIFSEIMDKEERTIKPRKKTNILLEMILLI